jgi:hypothetical protein
MTELSILTLFEPEARMPSVLSPPQSSSTVTRLFGITKVSVAFLSSLAPSRATPIKCVAWGIPEQ